LYSPKKEENDFKKSYNKNHQVQMEIGMADFYVWKMHNVLCPNQYSALPLNADVKFNFDDRTLTIDTGLQMKTYQSGFCIDNFLSFQNGLYVSAFICQNAIFDIIFDNKTSGSSSHGTQQQLNGTCWDKDLVNFNKKLRSAYTFCGLFSLVFLIITLFVYITLPTLNNLHGKIVMSNVTSILITTLLLILIYNVQKANEVDEVNNYNTEEEFFIIVPSSVCAGLGYALYYAGISMFCWMSVMCIDLCWTFARATIPR
jgi:uncharacterized membrane protein